MLFEQTIKQLRWYFKGQITTWGVWINRYYYDTKTVKGTKYGIRSKEISIPDSKTNRQKYARASRKFYTELKFPSYCYTSASDWKYKTDFTSDVWKAEGAHYTCIISIDESALTGMSLEWLRGKAVDPSSYQADIDTRQYPNGALVSSLSGVKINDMLRVRLSNSGSVNEGVDNVDVFPYEFTSTYINEDDGSPFVQEEKLAESDCNLYVRRILINEVVLFIDEIIKAKSSRKRLDP